MPDIITVVPQEMDPIVIEVYTGLQGATGTPGATGATGPAGPTTLIIADVLWDFSQTQSDAQMFTLLQEGDVVDGVTLVAGMVVFVPYRTTYSQGNGFWRVQAGGANPIREPTITFEMMVGSLVSIKQGTKYSRTVWNWVGAASGTLGTTPVLYDRLSEQTSFIMMRDVGIVEKNEILIPAFYYVDGREGMVLVSPTLAAPNQTRYFSAPLSNSRTNIIRVWYDRAYHIANPSDAHGAIKSETNVTRVTTNMYQEPEICVSNFGNVTSRYNFIGDSSGVGKNIYFDSLNPESNTYTTTQTVVPFTDAAILAAGIPTGIKGVGSSYSFFTLSEALMGNEYVFIRAYVESPDDNVFAVPEINFRSQTKLNSANTQAAFGLTLEKQLSARAAIYSGWTAVTSIYNGVTYLLIGQNKGALSTDFIIGGIQVGIQRNSPINWIMRNDYPRGFNAAPVMGKDLWLNTGREMPIYLRNLFRDYTYDDFSYGGISSLNTAANNYPYAMQSKDTLRLNPSLMGGTAQLAVLSYTNSNMRWTMDLDVHIAAASGLTGSPKIMMIGDGSSHFKAAHQLNLKLAGMGLTPTWIGTIPASVNTSTTNASGPLGEYRWNRGWGDLSGLVADADTPAYFALGTEATYTALSKTNKQAQNPFLRLATGGDSPTYTTAGGYIFDFRHYLNRFGFADPDIVMINLGLDDIMERATIAEAVADVNLIVPFILSNIRAAVPGVKIGVWLNITGPVEVTKVYWPLMQAVNAALIAAVNAQPWGTFTIPVHAHMSNIAGWLPATSLVADTATGLKRGITESPFQTGYGDIIEQITEPLAAFVSNVQTWHPLAVRNRAAVLTAGGRMSDTEFYFRSKFYADLVTNGLWSYIDEFWFGTTYDSVAQQVLVSGVNGIVGTGVNAPTYGPLHTVFGSSPHIRSGYIPSVHGRVISGDNFGMLFYDRSAVSDVGNSAFGAYVSDTQNMFMANRNNVGRLVGGLGTVVTNSSAVVDSNLSLSGITRATGASVREEWRRGVNIGSTALGTNGTVLPNIELYLGGRNENGVRNNVRNSTMSMAMVIAPMSAPQHLALYNIVQAMMTARGGAV